MTWNPLSVMFSLVVDINFRMVLRRTLFSVNVLQRDRLPVQMWVEMITLFLNRSTISHCCNLICLRTTNWSLFWLHCRYNHSLVCHASGSNYCRPSRFPVPAIAKPLVDMVRSVLQEIILSWFSIFGVISSTRTKIRRVLLEIQQKEEFGVRYGEVTKNYFLLWRIGSSSRAWLRSCAFIRKMEPFWKCFMVSSFECDVFTALNYTVKFLLPALRLSRCLMEW